MESDSAESGCVQRILESVCNGRTVKGRAYSRCKNEACLLPSVTSELPFLLLAGFVPEPLKSFGLGVVLQDLRQGFLEVLWLVFLVPEDSNYGSNAQRHLTGNSLDGQSGFAESDHFAAVEDALRPADPIAALRAVLPSVFHSAGSGADVNQAQPDGTRPIHWAAYRVDYDPAELASGVAKVKGMPRLGVGKFA